MQPYFFPYIGYFSLIKHVNEFMLFDTPQFIRHGWIERNRILKQNEGWLYIKVPLAKHSREEVIKNVQIDESQPWRRTILSQLEVYKKIAPHYIDVRAMVEESLVSDATSIVDLNKRTLETVCRYLGISTPITLFSEAGLSLGPVDAPDEWALRICQAMGDPIEYWNPPGGMSFFDKGKYDDAGVALKFHSIRLQEYDQRRVSFEPGLSVVDVLMFNSVDEVNRMLDNYEVK